MLLKHTLYEAAVANGPALARFARAIHGGKPLTLAEDFSGTAALARAWLGLNEKHRAIACDASPAVVKNIPRAFPGVDRLTLRRRDVLRVHDPCDVLAATNFAVCYWHERRDLVRYFAHARSRLSARGVFFCDVYGGVTAFTTGVQERRVVIDGDRGRRSFRYIWEQLDADPITGHVHNTIHFEIPAGFVREGAPPRRIARAFTYHWRLWSISELLDAMEEAGFDRARVYNRTADAIDDAGNVRVEALTPEESLDPDYVVYLCASCS